MSSIPNSAMPHAKVKHDDDVAPPAKGDWMDDATDAAKAGIATATDAVKSHPKTAIAVGATSGCTVRVVAGSPLVRFGIVTSSAPSRHAMREIGATPPR